MNRKYIIKFGYLIVLFCFLIGLIFRIECIYMEESHGLIGVGGILLLLIIWDKILPKNKKKISGDSKRN